MTCRRGIFARILIRKEGVERMKSLTAFSNRKCEVDVSRY